MSSVPHAEALGRAVHGPSALGGDARRFIQLTWTLAVMDFKLRFFGSVLGYLWQLVRPLMIFGVLYFVFTQAIKLGDQVKHFPVLLLANIVLYTYFAEATGGAVTSVVDRENLVRKIEVPRLVIPAAAVLTATFNLGLNLIILFIFLFATDVEPNSGWLYMPLILGALVVMAVGTATLLSALYVRFRDVKPIWDVGLQVLFYATPIIYAVETVDNPETRKWFMLNPLGALLQQMRHWFIDPTAPTAHSVAGSWALLAIPLGLVVGVLVVGFWYFNREAPRIAEEL